MGALLKVISQVIFAKFLEDSVRHFTHRLMNYSSGNRFTQFSQKYTNTINNVEVKIKNYIFIFGLMLLAVFLVIVSVLSIILSLVLYLVNMNQIAVPFIIFGIIVAVIAISLIFYSQRTLRAASPKTNLKV